MEKVTAYWTDSAGKTFIYTMFDVDYREAVANHPDEWSLQPPPGAAELTDRRVAPIVIKDQKSNPPPFVDEHGIIQPSPAEIRGKSRPRR